MEFLDLCVNVVFMSFSLSVFVMVVFISLRQTVLADVMAGYDMNSHGAGGAEAEGAEGTEAEATEEANGQHLAGHDMNALAELVVLEVCILEKIAFIGGVGV